MKNNDKKDNRPYWVDDDRIRTAKRFAALWRNYANSYTIPLCETCGLNLSTETMLAYMDTPELIESDYIAGATGAVGNEFLARTVEVEAARRYSEIITGFEPKNKMPKKEFVFYAMGAQEYMRFEDIRHALSFDKGVCRVSDKVIEAQYTHFLSDTEIDQYNRQKEICEALNGFFGGKADITYLLAAFHIEGGVFVPNTRFNYKLIK